jgi:hypothetical protein
MRALAGLLVLSGIAAGACTASEPVDVRRNDGGPAMISGEAGSGAGTAGTGGASSGAAGASGTGASGHAGTTGTAGSTTGAGAGAGSGTAGTGAAGTSGASGTGGKVDAGAAGSGVKDAGAEAPSATVYTYTGGIENLLIQNCGGCHYAAPGVNVQGGFSFSYANVTGVTNGHPGCTALDASKRRVVPGKPDNSLLWIKAFMDSPPSGCGGHMPFQGSRLSDATLGYLKAWILAGAPQ